MKLRTLTTILALTTTFSISSFADTTGEITISGTVDPELSITLSTNSYTNLDIINGGDHTVATANEVCNDLDGYVINGYSDNGSELQNQTDNAIKTTYTVKYDGGTAKTLGVGSANKVELKDSGALTTAADETSNIVVDVAAFATAPAGTYEDTITLEIVAN